MKHLLIALIALTFALGAGCKKSNELAGLKPSTETKKVVEKAPDLKPEVLGIVDGSGGIVGGVGSYPHNTGACTCGKYGVCHPLEYVVYDEMTRQYRIYRTAYGQTTFPPGAEFPGNQPHAD